MRPYNMPGRFMSAPYKALPVTLSYPSCLTGLLPTAFNCESVFFGVVVIKRAAPLT